MNITEKNQQRIKIMQEKLTEVFHPSHLVIIDESYKHVGHEGAKTGQGHFALEISSELLNGKTAVQKHRMIYAALGDLMKTDIHALRISTDLATIL